MRSNSIYIIYKYYLWRKIIRNKIYVIENYNDIVDDYLGGGQLRSNLHESAIPLSTNSNFNIIVVAKSTDYLYFSSIIVTLWLLV